MKANYKKTGFEYTHRLVAEKALGRPLKGSECVHHIDENGFNPSNNNLVICPDAAYHKLLHIRADAYDVCGHASYRSCMYCKTYDNPASMTFVLRPRGSYYYHKTCATKNYHLKKEKILAHRAHRRSLGRRN